MSSRIIRTASGVPVVVRAATADDLTAVNEMHGRCSPRTLISRYAAGRGALLDREWRRMVDPARGRTFVLAGPDERDAVIGFATLLRVTATGMAEVSLLLRDDWQNAGVGRALARYLVGVAGQLRFAGVVAWIAPDNVRARKLLRGLGGAPELADGEVRWVVASGYPQRAVRSSAVVGTATLRASWASAASCMPGS
ncbi:GNAT family N-acetyltransferase [Cryptosporangium phraense]|uniref:GNAT family N-acetyltransferase n=1 Tax=Cryptosporangium phraense TaxID=2593070 RepID=A0A545ARG9_9ACTN|nr:GNAT family N-acetyltransferase [Cryptosporangium phraense]TQS43917.1 GNAT family N-acetyltransferase [Cryptosporangium phraense]